MKLMKKPADFRVYRTIAILAFLLVVELYVTKSMYVEWLEFILIVLGLSTIAVNWIGSKKEQEMQGWLIKTVLIGFLGMLLFTSLDLIMDRFYVIQGVPDGKFLTLAETFGEFRNTQFMMTCIGTAIVILITTFIRGFSSSR